MAAAFMEDAGPIDLEAVFERAARGGSMRRSGCRGRARVELRQERPRLQISANWPSGPSSWWSRTEAGLRVAGAGREDARLAQVRRRDAAVGGHQLGLLRPQFRQQRQYRDDLQELGRPGLRPGRWGGSPPGCPARAAVVRAANHCSSTRTPPTSKSQASARDRGDAALVEEEGLLVAVVVQSSGRAGSGARTYGRRPPGSLGRSPSRRASATASGAPNSMPRAQSPGSAVSGTARPAAGPAARPRPSRRGRRPGPERVARGGCRRVVQQARRQVRFEAARGAGTGGGRGRGDRRRERHSGGRRRRHRRPARLGHAPSARPRTAAARRPPATTPGAPRRSAGGPESATARRTGRAAPAPAPGRDPTARVSRPVPVRLARQLARPPSAGCASGVGAEQRLALRPFGLHERVPTGLQGRRRREPSATPGPAAAVRRTTA